MVSSIGSHRGCLIRHEFLRAYVGINTGLMEGQNGFGGKFDESCRTIIATPPQTPLLLDGQAN